MTVTHLTEIVSLYHHPEEGRVTGRSMLLNILHINKKYATKL